MKCSYCGREMIKKKNYFECPFDANIIVKTYTPEQFKKLFKKYNIPTGE